MGYHKILEPIFPCVVRTKGDRKRTMHDSSLENLSNEWTQNLGFSEQSWANLVRKRWRPKERKRKRTFFSASSKKTSPVIGNKVLQNHYESVGSWILLSKRKFRFVANMRNLMFSFSWGKERITNLLGYEKSWIALFCQVLYFFFFIVKSINLLYTKTIFELIFKHKIEMYPLRYLNNGAMTVTTK